MASVCAQQSWIVQVNSMHDDKLSQNGGRICVSIFIKRCTNVMFWYSSVSIMWQAVDALLVSTMQIAFVFSWIN